MTNVTIDFLFIILYNRIIRKQKIKEIKIMNEYIVSTSFDKTNKEAQIISGCAENIGEFIEKAFIDDYFEYYYNEYMDEAILKFTEPNNVSKVYFVFPNILS